MTTSYDDLRELVRHNSGQGTFEEYAYLLDTIRAHAPAKLLIFGVGKDSVLWHRANAGGRTVFVEHEAEWLARTREQIPDGELVQVRYGFKRWQWRFLLPVPALLFMKDLPASIVNESWDIIFVDSPQGGNWKRPGRMTSLYTASVLARRPGKTELLAHDCDRRVEQAYCDRYLGAQKLQKQVRTLRHYTVDTPA